MTLTNINIDPALLLRTRQLTGARSNREVVDLALRRLVAHESKGEMVDAISALSDLPQGLNAPTVAHRAQDAVDPAATA